VTSAVQETDPYAYDYSLGAVVAMAIMAGSAVAALVVKRKQSIAKA